MQLRHAAVWIAGIMIARRAAIGLELHTGSSAVATARLVLCLRGGDDAVKTERAVSRKAYLSLYIVYIYLIGGFAVIMST